MDWRQPGSERFHGRSPRGRAALIDVHSHLLPGVDDGPRTLDEACEMCRTYAKCGYTTVIATPHMSNPAFDVSPEDVRARTREVQAACAQQGVELEVLPGAEVRLEPAMLDKVDSGRVLSLGDSGRYLLIELPRQMMPRLDYLGAQLAERRVTPIIAHPERNIGIRRCPGRLSELVEAGWLVQITAGALIGTLGSRSMKAARFFVKQGLVHLVATDAHGTPPLSPDRTRAVERCISMLAGQQRVDALLRKNPAQIVSASRSPESKATAPA